MSHLLTSKLAETLYTSIEGLPIVDYHTHLPADEILNDHQFENIWELWLKHDHYKWRLMRGCGVEEKFITGDASPYEKFHAFASILPLAIGNPVHQWAHMELEKIFNITIPLNAETAEGIWNQTNRELSDSTTVNKLLQLLKSNSSPRPMTPSTTYPVTRPSRQKITPPRCYQLSDQTSIS